MNLARRNLAQDKLRLALSVAGVALAVMLILILNGFVTGIDRQVTTYLDHMAGGVVLVQPGSNGLQSVLADEVAVAARATAGVERAVPVVVQYAVLDLGGAKQYADVVGYDPADGGGPWSLGQGRHPRMDREVVLDETLAASHGVRIGDTFRLMGDDLEVVGLSRNTTTWMVGYLFVRLTEAQRLFGMANAVSVVFVSAARGISDEGLRSRLQGIKGADAMLRSELIEKNRQTYLSVFSAPVNLMAGIASLVGALAVGMVVYAATVERRREYGVLKAIGARNAVLYRVVAVQALAAAIPGALAGMLLALGAAALIMALRPQFLISVEPRSMLLALVAGLGMALAAALLPARLISGLAPAEVFRR